MPDPSPSTLTVLNFNFLQLGSRSGGRPQRTVYPGRLPVNTVKHTALARIEPTTFRLLVRRTTSSATDSSYGSKRSKWSDPVIIETSGGRGFNCGRHSSSIALVTGHNRSEASTKRKIAYSYRTKLTACTDYRIPAILYFYFSK